jgi:hypothetical protein
MSIGMAGIAIGFLLLIRYKRPKVLETSTNKDSMISQTQFNEKEPASNSSDSTA